MSRIAVTRRIVDEDDEPTSGQARLSHFMVRFVCGIFHQNTVATTTSTSTITPTFLDHLLVFTTLHYTYGSRTPEIDNNKPYRIDFCRVSNFVLLTTGQQCHQPPIVSQLYQTASTNRRREKRAKTPRTASFTLACFVRADFSAPTLYRIY